jgi:hypothetical protein
VVVLLALTVCREAKDNDRPLRHAHNFHSIGQQGFGNIIENFLH